MSESALTHDFASSAGDSGTNGFYRFDPGQIQTGLVFASIGLAAVFVFGAWASLRRGLDLFGMLLLLLISLGLVWFLIHVKNLSGRTLEITDKEISVFDKRKGSLGRLFWEELGLVTERRKMAQLALWDRSGRRRVLVDQQYEDFPRIRQRILSEYARAFVPKPLPIELRSTSPFRYETFVMGFVTLLSGVASCLAFSQNQPIASLFLLGFASFGFWNLLLLYPRLGGPSVIYEDRIVIRRLFRKDEVRKKDVAGVDLADVANGNSGAKFSMVVLRTIDNRKVKITFLYGSIPEIYLTLRAWLART
ncbi:MAG TPA: hypothetical protein VMJ93_17095 [Verrucomicrobiae bacterium]|nr:hypothetical protein [Verrucomicrobiae bacterium]